MTLEPRESSISIDFVALARILHDFATVVANAANNPFQRGASAACDGVSTILARLYLLSFQTLCASALQRMHEDGRAPTRIPRACPAAAAAVIARNVAGQRPPRLRARAIRASDSRASRTRSFAIIAGWDDSGRVHYVLALTCECVAEIMQSAWRREIAYTRRR